MKSKAKIGILVCAIALVACVLGVGVYAAITKTLEFKNNVSFSSTNVKAEVAGTVAGTATAVTPYSETFGDTTDTETKNWTINNLSFKDNGEAIVITLTVTNKGDNLIDATFTAPTPVANLTIKYGEAGSETNPPANGSSIAKDKTWQVVIHLTPTSLETNVSGNLTFSVVLQQSA